MKFKSIFNPTRKVNRVYTDGAKFIGVGLGVATIVLLGFDTKPILIAICFGVFGFITRLK